MCERKLQWNRLYTRAGVAASTASRLHATARLRLSLRCAASESPAQRISFEQVFSPRFSVTSNASRPLPRRFHARFPSSATSSSTMHRCDMPAHFGVATMMDGGQLRRVGHSSFMQQRWEEDGVHKNCKSLAYLGGGSLCIARRVQ